MNESIWTMCFPSSWWRFRTIWSKWVSNGWMGWINRTIHLSIYLVLEDQLIKVPNGVHGIHYTIQISKGGPHIVIGYPTTVSPVSQLFLLVFHRVTGSDSLGDSHLRLRSAAVEPLSSLDWCFSASIPWLSLVLSISAWDHSCII